MESSFINSTCNLNYYYLIFPGMEKFKIDVYINNVPILHFILYIFNLNY